VTADREDEALFSELHGLVKRELGADVVRLEALRGGVGHRRFFRLHLRGAAEPFCVARIDRGTPAPGVLPEPPLEPTRAFLAAHDLPVPRRLGGDSAAGIDLLVDVGSRSRAEVASTLSAREREPLYRAACDLVPRLQRLRDPTGRIPAFGRRLDTTLLAAKARRFLAAVLLQKIEMMPRERPVCPHALAVDSTVLEKRFWRFLCICRRCKARLDAGCDPYALR
jgi:hypothetical protein